MCKDMEKKEASPTHRQWWPPRPCEPGLASVPPGTALIRPVVCRALPTLPVSLCGPRLPCVVHMRRALQWPSLLVNEAQEWQLGSQAIREAGLGSRHGTLTVPPATRPRCMSVGGQSLPASSFRHTVSISPLGILWPHPGHPCMVDVLMGKGDLLP